MTNRSGLDLLLDLKDAVGTFIKADDNADDALIRLTDALEKCEAYEDEAWARKIDEDEDDDELSLLRKLEEATRRVGLHPDGERLAILAELDAWRADPSETT